MKTVLITGVTGFAGSFLAESLRNRPDLTLHGTYLSDDSLKNVTDVPNLSLHKIDLTDGEAVNSLIQELRPDHIYHLAALPSPADSFANPSLYIHNNVDVQLNILEALRKYKLHETRVLIVSSAEIYGQVHPDDLPLDENTPMRPTSPYSVSKATQDLLGLQYFLTHKLPIIRVRPFNHIGPRQSPAFVVAAFAKQIAEIEKNRQDAVIKVGNLDAKRDFTDVRDMVKAYIVLMEKGVPGDVYNIGSGQSIAIKEILNKLVDMSAKEMKIEVDPSRLRPSDIPDLVCDTTKIGNLGWKAHIQIEDTLKDTLDYWRAII